MKDKKNLLIGALVFAIVAMAVGYAAFSTTLTINGRAEIDAAWDVEITGIQRTGQSGNAGQVEVEDITSPSNTTTTATFNTKLKAPGAWAEYTITIENKGTLNAELDTAAVLSAGTTLVGNTNGQTVEGTPATGIIDYEIVTAPAATLNNRNAASGSTTTMVVRVSWDATDTISNPDYASLDPIAEAITLGVVYKQATT